MPRSCSTMAVRRVYCFPRSCRSRSWRGRGVATYRTRLFPAAAQDDIRGSVAFPDRVFPLLIGGLPTVVDAQLPRLRVHPGVFDGHDVDDVVGGGDAPSFDEVQRVRMKGADDVEPGLVVVV